MKKILLMCIIAPVIMSCSTDPIAKPVTQEIEVVKSDKKTYEYRIIFIADDLPLGRLNDFGEHGWQVTSARRAQQRGKYGYELILMKQAWQMVELRSN